MAKVQHRLTVIKNEKLCPRFYRLVLDGRGIASRIKPGQFVHIKTAEGFEPFFRRPFSVFRADKNIEVFYEPVGPGTKLMAAMKKGLVADILGPLGTPFCAPPKGIKHIVMIAGGIGIAPFQLLSDKLKSKKFKMTLLYGGRTKQHVYPMKEFKQNGVKVFVSTDDGSVGVKGRVSNLFSKINWDPKTTFIYTCGPNPMMKAVQQFAKEHAIRGEAACEEVMACALGACLGCSIKTTSGYKTVCYDGPVFGLDEIIF